MLYLSQKKKKKKSKPICRMLVIVATVSIFILNMYVSSPREVLGSLFRQVLACLVQCLT